MAMTKAPTTTTEDDITAETLRRFEGTPDPRLREIMISLTRHLHGFLKEVQLTEGEWFEAIKFLTRPATSATTSGRSSSCCRTHSACRWWST